MNGQPCIRGMRLTVRRVIEALALNSERADVRREFPELEDDDITQALEFAALCLDEPFCRSTPSNAPDAGQATRLGFLNEHVLVPDNFAPVSAALGHDQEAKTLPIRQLGGNKRDALGNVFRGDAPNRLRRSQIKKSAKELSPPHWMWSTKFRSN